MVKKKMPCRTVSEASRTYFGVNSALGRCEQTPGMKNQLVTPHYMLCRMSRCKSRALPATFSLSIKLSSWGTTYPLTRVKAEETGGTSYSHLPWAVSS